MVRAGLRGILLLMAAIAPLGTAVAADLSPLPAPPPTAPPVRYAPPVYNWSGIYFGGHIGAGYAGSSWADFVPGMPNDRFNDWGFLGGAQLGANVQYDRFVFGAEGEFSWTNAAGKGLDSLGDQINTKVPWTTTVTGRVGAAFNRLLVYAKGGLALAQDRSGLTDLGGSTSTSNMLRTGWTAGVGLEYALDENWSARLEYDYLDFGSKPLSFTTPALGTVTTSSRLDVGEIKAGLNYRFNAP